MALTSAAAPTGRLFDPAGDARMGVTVLGLALGARWLVATLLLGGGVFVGSRQPLSHYDWLLLVQGRAFVDVVLAAVTTAGAFAATRIRVRATTSAGFGLRLFALLDLAFAFAWALDGALLPPYVAARLVAITALVHAAFAYLALRHLGAVCARAGAHGASAWARAGAWAFVVAALLALGSSPAGAWIALGLTVPVTNPALPVIVVVSIYVTLRARHALDERAGAEAQPS